jgi:hypothetical protein
MAGEKVESLKRPAYAINYAKASLIKEALAGEKAVKRKEDVGVRR